MIYENAATGCEEQSFDVDRQPEEISGDRHGAGLRVRVKYENVENDDNRGHVADEPADITELHESVHLAYCTTQSLVTSTKCGYSIQRLCTAVGDLWRIRLKR